MCPTELKEFVEFDSGGCGADERGNWKKNPLEFINESSFSNSGSRISGKIPISLESQESKDSKIQKKVEY